MTKDALGTRMKEQYELRTRSYLPRRTYTIIRLDGKAFHTYTRKCIRPYDGPLSTAMIFTTDKLVKEIQGCVFGYTQSDEISLLLTDFGTIHTDAWFDGNVQKMVSVSASVATAHFNEKRIAQECLKEITAEQRPGPAYFDSRVFTIPDRVEVMNYFIWRQKDATRNSLSMLAQSHFSAKQLHGKSQADMHEMLHTKGVNWDQCSPGQKRGILVTRTGGLGSCAAPEIWSGDLNGELNKLIPNYPHM